MGTLMQFRPRSSSPWLQQASFWPLPHLASPVLESMPISLLPSEAPPWGAAKATAATEAMKRVLKKAIVDDCWFWVEQGWEASVVLMN